MSMLLNPSRFGGSNSGTPILPGITARHFRVRSTKTNDGNLYQRASLLRFLEHSGDTAQPGTGTAIGSGAAAGTYSDCFDSNDATNCAVPNSTGWIGFSFDTEQTIRAILYKSASSFVSQQPRHLKIEYSLDAGSPSTWIECTDIPALGVWGTLEQRELSLTSPVDEAGGYRYWAIDPSATYGGDSLYTFIEFELLQAGVNLATRWEEVTTSIGGNTSIVDGVITGDSYGGGNPISADVVIDLGYARVVDSVRLTARQAPWAGQTPKTFNIKRSSDGASYTTEWSVADLGSTPAANEQRTYPKP